MFSDVDQVSSEAGVLEVRPALVPSAAGILKTGTVGCCINDYSSSVAPGKLRYPLAGHYENMTNIEVY